MGPPRFTVAVITLVSALLIYQASVAAADPRTDHVRPRDQRTAALVEEGARRSASFRWLLTALDRSMVFVYVEQAQLPPRLRGRLRLGGRGQQWRYLRVEIECQMPDIEQVAVLGHELQHALEIAVSPSTVDAESVQRLYEAIGFATDPSRRHFETDAAREMGARVRQELFAADRDSGSSMRKTTLMPSARPSK